MQLRKQHPERRMSELADHYMLADCPDYAHDESTATITRREYREELETRAEEGDRYAASLLRGVQWDEPTE